MMRLSGEILRTVVHAVVGLLIAGIVVASAVVSCAVVRGQGLDPDWTDVPAVRQPRSIADDPAVHFGRDYGGPHETTHAINARLRQQQPGVNAAYVLRGKAALIPEPPLSLVEIAAAVPAEKRGEVYRLYMVQSIRDWNRQPLYIFDEWTAYANGVECYAGADPAQSRHSLGCAKEMGEYAAVLLSVVRRRAPLYDSSQLTRFYLWQRARLSRLSVSAVFAPVEIVALTARWCQFCPRMRPVWSAVEAEGVKVWVIDVDEDGDWKAARIPVPATLVYRNGREVARLVGVRTLEELKSELRKETK